MLIINMIKCFCTALFVCFYINFAHFKEIYEIRADDLVDTMLENVYKGKFQLFVPTHNATTKIATSDTTPGILTTRAFATKHPPKMYPTNMTIEEFNLRKRKLDIATFLQTDINAIPDFDNDEINVQIRRFDKVKNSTDDNTLRQYYFDDESGWFIYREKGRIISLMQQFIYQIRYQLDYAQLMRKKYILNIKYRIGYCFALIRRLKQQQMVIYNTFNNYLEVHTILFIHLKFYEKVVKLDVDIKDLIKFIVHLNEVRKKEEYARTTTTNRVIKGKS